ncbi:MULTISPECIES: hypothetical protein [unclassified Streptomyces]|uniref:hypothetical protein n=1 Tax=unclassified Streptomyces TaxID=2593676 RepID=UPI00382001B1
MTMIAVTVTYIRRPLLGGGSGPSVGKGDVPSYSLADDAADDAADDDGDADERAGAEDDRAVAAVRFTGRSADTSTPGASGMRERRPGAGLLDALHGRPECP